MKASRILNKLSILSFPLSTSITTFALMASIRQQKIAGVIQKELSQIFRIRARTVCLGAMVSVTVVRMSPDMGLAKVYLSVFGVENKEDVIESIKVNSKAIRHELSQITKNQLRRVPELMFYLDDSLDYAEEIDQLLNKG